MGDVFIGGKKKEKERRKEKRKGRERKERDEKKREREREREREKKGREKDGEKETGVSLAHWRSDSRDSSNEELKSVYAMRATLQEVGILPTLVSFPP